MSIKNGKDSLLNDELSEWKVTLQDGLQEKFLNIQECHIQAIKEGISAVDSGKTADFSAVKKRWVKLHEN